MTKEPLDHMVLIVDDEEQVGRAVGRLLKNMGVKYVYMDSGPSALERIQSASSPFSMIISDQRMPGMTGAELLAQVKDISANTIRFLLTGYADVDAVTQAVNQGAIHRYIAKPWNNKEFIQTISTGLEQYSLLVENDKLFHMAKAQNAKLFTLNKELKKSTAVHQKALLHKDNEIEKLKEKLEIGFENRNYIHEIETLLKESEMLEQERINALYAAIVAELFEQFQDIATRNGFEMPDNIPGE